MGNVALIYLRRDPGMSDEDVSLLQVRLLRFARERDLRVTGIFVEHPKKSPTAPAVTFDAFMARLTNRGADYVLVPSVDHFSEVEKPFRVVEEITAVGTEVVFVLSAD